MHLKLEAHEDYHIMRRDYGMILFVAAIKDLNFNFNRQNHSLHTLNDAKGLYTLITILGRPQIHSN